MHKIWMENHEEKCAITGAVPSSFHKPSFSSTYRSVHNLVTESQDNTLHKVLKTNCKGEKIPEVP